jgi:iron complex outermembrane recepter protein
MKVRMRWGKGWLVAVALLAIGEPMPAQEAAKGTLEEIVVTARRREELLVDTPVSVTALTEQIARAGVHATRRHRGRWCRTCNFSIGRENQEGFIRLRGVGTASGEIVFDPGVAVYVDGVYLPRMIGHLIDVSTSARSRCCAGPQGTLFGKNSVGGAINITTVKPQPELEGRVSVIAGNYDTVRTRAMLNVPLIEDRLLSRFAFATNNVEGWARNEALDIDLPDQSALAFLGSLRWLVTDDITVDLSGTWGRDHGHGRSGQCRTVNDNGLAVTLIPGFAEACEQTEPYRFSGNVAGLSDTSSWGSWGTVTWDALQGPIELSVKSITSWREQKPAHRSEGDLTEFPVLSLDFSDSEEDPSWSQRQISQELQTNLSAWEGRFSLVSGIFSFWESGNAPTTVRALTDVLDVETQSTTTIDNWSWAVYTHAVVDPVEWLSLTVGVRYTQDKKGATFVLVDRTAGTTSPFATGSEVFDAVTPTASIGFKATDAILDTLRLDDGLLYFTYSQGFRGGGFNSLINVQGFQGTDLPKFDPETLDNFEIGLKTNAFDNRASFSIAAFYGLYEDIQVFSTRTTGDPTDPGSITIQTLTQNAAEATTQGIEAETLLLLTDELRVNASIGLLNTEYDDFGRDCDPTTVEGRSNCAISDIDYAPPAAQYIDRSGQGFNLTPDLTTNLGISYAIPIDAAPRDWLVGYLTPRLDWAYQSRMHVLGPEAEDSIQHGFHLLHARLSYDFWDERAQIALWGKNLTDEEYFDRAETYPVLGFLARYFQTPRTFGGEISLRF